MRDYLLFIDTETSGLPANWQQPYAHSAAWPHVVQVAWVIYGRAGELIKTESYYLKPGGYDISPAAGRIHGLTLQFLEQQGQGRHLVMQQLLDDLRRYEPLLVGHFMELDFHMLGVTLHRAGLPNGLLGLPTFCTMRLTDRFVRPAGQRFLRLPELYERLFNRPMLREHDALLDAQATAACFFELWRKGDINEEMLAAQVPLRPPAEAVASRWRRLFG
ncbi:exonuclease domain-containing protein [uncultured Hymenobacter sp.]|uniref:3'-5' exonuclease n=1 Tax=uncultured Hymenobacter sp. TaxID=170016 RepID=UPI0035CB6094